MNQITTSIVLFVGCTLAALASPPPDGALWNADRTAAVAAIPGTSGTQVTAYIERPDGTFLEIDLSNVEGGNFGKLGRRSDEYDRFETTPLEWLPRNDGLLQVEIRTRAWRGGQRFTVSEPIVFRADGTVIWR